MGWQGAIAIFSMVVSASQAETQRREASEARGLQREANNARTAQNAADAAKERRQQIREERVRRARVIQASINTGVADSSGELGAVGALSTNLNSNIGSNLGKMQTAENISIFNQGAADAQGNIQEIGNQMQLTQSIFNMSLKFPSSASQQKELFGNPPARVDDNPY